jgi:selT/selW/selH-like putative selenoprotein
LKKELDQTLDVELIAGSGGVFEVMVDNRLVFSKRKKGRFPHIGEIAKLIS